MTSTGRRRLRRTTIAALVCAAGLAAAPAAMGQGIQPPATGIEPVDTVVGSLNGGIQQTHKYQCDGENPIVKDMITGVRRSLSTIYPNITVMEARGYFPYADAPLFGLSGRQGHWINPSYIGDIYPAGHPKAGQPRLMDPEYPESILVDRWNRPIGVMFIADDPYVPGPDMYVDEDTGIPCNGWHYHTETTADAYWYAYKYGWSGDVQNGDVLPPDRTPDLMHVWRYGEYKYQWDHKAPPQEQMPGDPSEPNDFRKIIGGPRLPTDPPDDSGGGTR
jgi:hypothetical protein